MGQEEVETEEEEQEEVDLTSSFSDLVLLRRPQWRNLLGPTELVSELKVIFSWGGAD